MKHIFLTISSILICITVLNAHPIKVSTGEMIYRADKKEFVIKLRFFGDDFISSVNQKYHTNITMDKLDDKSSLLFQNFVKDYFWIKINEKKVIPVYSKISQDDQVIIMEYKISIRDISFIKNIEISYPILIDYFKEQQNIFRVDPLNDGNMTTYRFNKETPVEKKEFNQQLKK